MPRPLPSPASSSPSRLLLFFLLLLGLLVGFSASEGATEAATREINLKTPIIQFIPSQLVEYSSIHGIKQIISCERVRIVGLSRFNISSYASSLHVTVKASNAVLEKHHNKGEVCFHRNATLSLCQCQEDEWKNFQKGEWAAIMSPYGEKYLDVKFDSRVPGSVAVSIAEEFQQWRLYCLAFGFALLLLAPIVSSWVPFYYSSSMALGVLLVILIILFQGMKLIPTGRKSFLYLTLYGSILGAGSFLVHYFSMVVNSILVSFGLSEEMYNPELTERRDWRQVEQLDAGRDRENGSLASTTSNKQQSLSFVAVELQVSIFLLVGITLAGAALGYWVVRKFVLLEDGTVDSGIAQFVKWAMRILGFVFIFQSTLDTILAFAALVIFWSICSLVTSVGQWLRSLNQRNSRNANIWQLKTGQMVGNHRHAEFLSRSPNTGPRKPSLSSRNSPYSWTNSPTKGLVYSTPLRKRARQTNYYSTFHKTPTRKFSKEEWDTFTRESTREALAELVSTPDFSDWIAENAGRIHLAPKESSDSSTDSSSDSSEETIVESDNGLGFFGGFIRH